jgi:hypothetical protein
MVESSDLQSAIQRTQATERIQQLQSQQEELNRKRFELEMARQRAEKEKKIQDLEKTEGKRVIRDRYDGEEGAQRQPPREGNRGEEAAPDDEDRPRGGNLDVRV